MHQRADKEAIWQKILDNFIYRDGWDKDFHYKMRQIIDYLDDEYFIMEDVDPLNEEEDDEEYRKEDWDTQF